MALLTLSLCSVREMQLVYEGSRFYSLSHVLCVELQLLMHLWFYMAEEEYLWQGQIGGCK